MTTTWSDGQLRSLVLETNAFPKTDACLPDEVFLASDEGGERYAEICRRTKVYGGEEWRVYAGGDASECEVYEGFEGAFEYALLLARREVEEQ